MLDIPSKPLRRHQFLPTVLQMSQMLLIYMANAISEYFSEPCFSVLYDVYLYLLQIQSPNCILYDLMGWTSLSTRGQQPWFIYIHKVIIGQLPARAVRF